MGKSSLINAILGLDLTKTSKLPGKTRTLKSINLTKFQSELYLPRLVDCPGYGFARAAEAEKERWRKFMELYLREATSLHRVILLVDLTAGLTAKDKQLMDVLTDTSKPFILVITKCDKVKSKQVSDKA